MIYTLKTHINDILTELQEGTISQSNALAAIMVAIAKNSPQPTREENKGE